MSEWIRQTKPSWLHSLATAVLRSGPIPKHVAIIMDGNRRYARKNGMERAKGHLMGFDKLAETLEWCLDLGINEVTVYAFSIENFKRSKDEVDYLMELAQQKFSKLLEEREALTKRGVCIRVLGNLALLPDDLRRVISDAIVSTKDNTRAFLNVCIAYTSREEMCTAVSDIGEALVDGLLEDGDVTEALIDKCLYTADCQPVDLLIRTSGEVRLSDFLLWQSSFSVLSFLRVLWPDFSRWHLYMAVLFYQQNYAELQKVQDTQETAAQSEAVGVGSFGNDCGSEARIKAFLGNLAERRRAALTVAHQGSCQ